MLPTTCASNGHDAAHPRRPRPPHLRPFLGARRSWATCLHNNLWPMRKGRGEGEVQLRTEVYLCVPSLAAARSGGPKVGPPPSSGRGGSEAGHEGSAQRHSARACRRHPHPHPPALAVATRTRTTSRAKREEGATAAVAM